MEPKPSTRVSTRHSLRWRLPLLISGLIALVLATFLWAAYRRVEATLVQTAGERAQAAADQIAGLLDARRSTDQLRQFSDDPTLRRFLKTQAADAREAVRARFLAVGGGALRRFEVWDNAGTRLLEVSPLSVPGSGASTKVLPEGSPPSAAGVSQLQGTADLVFSDVVTEIRDVQAEPSAGSGDRLGYLRARTTFSENPPGIFSRLVGRDAVVRIANRTGHTWTDLSRMLPSAPVDLARPGVTQYRSESGEMRLGAVALVEATPWAAWVDFPMPMIVAPARVFLNRMIPVAILFVAAAALLATMLAARITTPLLQINLAAAAIAGGDYSRRVAVRRRDEIGQLGRTFNAMAADVEATADALKKSEDSYHRLFASNPHPMWVYDIETLRFIDVNTMATLQYGYSREEFLAMTVNDIRPDGDVAGPLQPVAGKEPAAVTEGVRRHRKKNGQIIDVEVSSHEVVLEGRDARVVLPHDVTERLRAQQALRRNEEMLRTLNTELEQRVLARTAQLEAANHELESFSYSVSHDLRAPLRHVQGYVEMVIASTAGQLSEKVQRYLKTITDATVEMGDLIDDLLAFSRLGRVQLSEGRVSLDGVVRDSISALEMATRNRNITWKIGPLPDVIGDPSLLKQVYVNVLGNAVKYTRHSDPAEIEIGCAGEEDGQSVLYVRDNGAGFDMLYAHKLFGVFQRLHRSDEFEGTGIGLATVRRIVTRHGGRTWAEGKVNGGATIYFSLTPAAQPAPLSQRTS